MNKLPNKITIISYLLLPGEGVFGEFVEQHFTINTKGQVWLTNYHNSQYRKHRSTLNKQRWKIDVAQACEVISRVIEYSQKNNDTCCGKEMVWYVTRAIGGKTITLASGSILGNDGSMTVWVRNLLSHEELIAFGGRGQTYNWEKIFS